MMPADVLEEVGLPSSMTVDDDGEVERTKQNKKINKKKVKKVQGNEDASISEEIPDAITKEDTMISKDLPPQNDSSSSSSGVNKSKTIFSDKNFHDLPISETYEKKFSLFYAQA